MSDTNADDSGFDKEAERERLREKYGGDSDERAETERMSELLLQGATMTNRHCGECGNPIFRYEGQAFCSVCEEERPPDGQETGSQRPEQGLSPDQVDEATEPADGHDSVGAPMDDGSRGEPDRQQATRETSFTGPEDTTRPEPERAAPDEVATPEEPSMGPDDTRSSGDLNEARATLVRTLSQMASKAETTNEVTRATQYLEAAREAAEALAALDRVRQR